MYLVVSDRGAAGFVLPPVNALLAVADAGDNAPGDSAVFSLDGSFGKRAAYLGYAEEITVCHGMFGVCRTDRLCLFGTLRREGDNG